MPAYYNMRMQLFNAMSVDDFLPSGARPAGDAAVKSPAVSALTSPSPLHTSMATTPCMANAEDGVSSV